ncbi:MAG: hypothetical protein AB7G15_16310, partial [Alphaproteobacteria bacterium]
MRKAVLAALAAALAAAVGTGPALAEKREPEPRGTTMFKRADTNRDGALTFDEWLAARDTLALRFDRNKD